MRIMVAAVALLGLIATGGTAFAEIGTADNVPAATLLVPYFEVDFANPAGITTLFSVNNASASAAVAHITLWTDEGIPTFAFDVYLTGFDVQTINLRDIFNGKLPVTADDGADPLDGISNQGALSQDINFPGTTGPCGSASTLYDKPDPSLPEKIVHIRAAHTGQFSNIYGGCLAADYNDSIARGYVTIDTVTACSLEFPNQAGYATGTLDFRNILWGDVLYVNPSQNFAQGMPAVHLEACVPGNGYNGYLGNGAGHCPFAPGDYMFYGRFSAVAGNSQREPLATTFGTRYVNGGQFDGGTSLLVWRDTKAPITSFAHTCGAPPPWFPLGHTDVVAFDEEENATDQCALAGNASPAAGPTCFPLATQRISLSGGNVVAANMALADPFGWLFLNLNHTLTSAADPFPGVGQAWVSTVMDADARFSVGFQAIQLQNALIP